MLGFDSNRLAFAHLPLAMRYRRVLWRMNIQWLRLGVLRYLSAIQDGLANSA